MKKVILMSILIGTFVIPFMAAGHRDLRKSVKVTQKRMLVFCFCYVIAVVYVMPRVP